MLTDKQASLIKKALRMMDYMRADLVAILADKPTTAETGEVLRELDRPMSPEVDPISGQPLPAGSPYSMAHLPKPSARPLAEVAERMEAHFPLHGAAVIHSTLSDVMVDVAARYPMQDGPATAYFYLTPSGAISIDHPVGVRHEYDTVRTGEFGSPEGAVAAYQAVLHDYLHPKVGTIYWRTRPLLEQSVRTGRHSVFSRLVVLA